MSGRPFDVDAIRARFPALSRRVDGREIAFLDGPAGTQVPRECIDAMSSYLETSNANTQGTFATSRETQALIAEARRAAADFIGADDPHEIVFGPNMTTLTFAMSRSFGRLLRPGDEIVVTRLDHDANVAPWLALAEDRGAVVRWAELLPDDCTLDLESLTDALSSRTRLVAVTLASNAVGTLPPVRRMADLVHAAGAWLWVDAVHAGPHVAIDVAALDADFLVCSPYKFFGPHLGVVWGRRELLDTLPPYKLRPAPDALPERFETGTGQHENLAGLLGTFRYLEWVGVSQAGAAGEPGGDDGRRRARLRAAMDASRAHELELIPTVIDGLCSIPGLRLYGIADPARSAERCSTFAFTLAGHHPTDIARSLADRAIWVWDGNYYAYELIRALGLAGSGGMVRVGLVHYNTAGEVERLVSALDELAGD